MEEKRREEEKSRVEEEKKKNVAGLDFRKLFITLHLDLVSISYKLALQ